MPEWNQHGKEVRWEHWMVFIWLCSFVSCGALVSVSCFSCVWLFATPWTVACWGPLSMGFPRQEYWSELPFPSPGDFPDPGIKSWSPVLQADSLLSEPPGKTYGPETWLNWSWLIIKVDFLLECFCGLYEGFYEEASPMAQQIKNLPTMQEMQKTWVRFLGQEDPSEECMATHSSILA